MCQFTTSTKFIGIYIHWEWERGVSFLIHIFIHWQMHTHFQCIASSIGANSLWTITPALILYTHLTIYILILIWKAADKQLLNWAYTYPLICLETHIYIWHVFQYSNFNMELGYLYVYYKEMLTLMDP